MSDLDSNSNVISITGTGASCDCKSTTHSWTTPGTVSSPTNLEFCKMQPVDTGKAPFSAQVIPAKFNSTWDYGLFWGYNVGLEKSGEPQALFGIEEDYEVTAGVHKVEFYWQYEDSARAHVIRPFFAQIDRSTNAVLSNVNLGPSASSQFQISTDTHSLVNVAPSAMRMGDATAAVSLTWQTPAAGELIGAANNAGTQTLEVLGQFSSDQLVIGDGNTFGHTFLRWDTRNGSLYWDGTNGQPNLGVGGQSYGGGQGVIAIKDRTTAPSTNPSGGGVLYSEGGALKWRGSNGTVTIIAPA